MHNNLSQNNFKSGQIVCLESDRSFLYGEVVQVIVQRQICWVRPLTIAMKTDNDSFNYDIADREIIDLRSASDLLLPLTLFRASYDTEAISLLAKLAAKEQSSNFKEVSCHLNSFVREVWSKNQEVFASSEERKNNKNSL